MLVAHAHTLLQAQVVVVKAGPKGYACNLKMCVWLCNFSVTHGVGVLSTGFHTLLSLLASLDKVIVNKHNIPCTSHHAAAKDAKRITCAVED